MGGGLYRHLADRFSTCEGRAFKGNVGDVEGLGIWEKGLGLLGCMR